MTRTPALLTAGMLACTLSLPGPATAQDLASSIVGTWKLTSFVRKEVASGKTAGPFGEKPNGTYMFSRGGRFMWFFVGENRKAPSAPNLTDADRVALYSTMAAGSGTFKIEGTKFIPTYEASWNQLWTGTRQPTDASLKGNTLTLTTAPFKAATDGVEIVAITTWERLE